MIIMDVYSGSRLDDYNGCIFIVLEIGLMIIMDVALGSRLNDCNGCI